MRAYTDYPFERLGDKPFCVAPVREIDVVSFDGNKYCKIIVKGINEEIKSGYIYTTETSFKPINPELLETNNE